MASDRCIATTSVDAVCLVTMTAPEAPEHGVELAKIVRAQLPHVRTLGLLLPGRIESPEQMPVGRFVDGVTTSFADAARDLLADRGRTAGP